METNDNTVIPTVTKQRSASYPYLTVQEALDFLKEIKRNFPNSKFNRADARAVVTTGSLNRDLGSCVQYGLLDKTQGEGYVLSKRYSEIEFAIDENERKQAIVKAFKSPKLYSELFEKFDTHILPSDKQLEAHLIRFHNITESAAPYATEVFVRNAEYAGVLSQNRLLNTSVEVSEIRNKDIDNSNNDSPLESPITNGNHNSQETTTTKKPLELQAMNNEKKAVLELTGNKIAYLIYPSDLNERDILIIEKQIEMMKLKASWTWS